MLGQLEDLSVSDIIQIIFLSRRTGILEISEKAGRSTILFIEGMIVNASSPSDPDLTTHLRNAYLREDALVFLRAKEEKGVPAGTATLELGLLTKEELGKAILERIRRIVTPMLLSRDGQFNFVVADSVSPMDVEYDPKQVFSEGGLTPQHVMATEGEKLKPLRGLAVTISAAKALRRSSEASVPSGNLPPAIEQAPFEEGPVQAGDESLESLLTGREVEHTAQQAVRRETSAKFSLGSATSQALAQRPSSVERTVLVVEPDPLLRVAVRRAFGKRGVDTLQFGTTADASKSIQELAAKNRFFVTILEGQSFAEQALSLLHFLKRTNRRLPVIIVYRELETQLRRRFAEAGADVFVRGPSEDVSRSSSGQADIEIFCGELNDLTEKAYESWEQMSPGLGAGEERGAQFYQMSEREKSGRGIGLLKQLITELSEPGDVSQITQMILRLSAEYLDRAVLFAADPGSFVALGTTGTHEAAAELRLSRSSPSVLRDVAESRKPHRGKLRRESANESLINSLGGPLPTEAVVLPVMNEEEVVGVLYGDNAAGRSPIGTVSGLEIFLSQAGFALRSALSGH